MTKFWNVPGSSAVAVTAGNRPRNCPLCPCDTGTGTTGDLTPNTGTGTTRVGCCPGVDLPESLILTMGAVGSCGVRNVAMDWIDDYVALGQGAWVSFSVLCADADRNWVLRCDEISPGVYEFRLVLDSENSVAGAVQCSPLSLTFEIPYDLAIEICCGSGGPVTVVITE